ncbi:MAG: FAD-dependent oxidoreductase [Pseudolysinimonas sp.]
MMGDVPPDTGDRDFADRAARYDVVVVGAGIVGLGHAWEAYRRGLTVAVVDRAAGIHGASARNFGHIAVTAQSGPALDYAEAGRATWKRLAVSADFALSSAGAIAVARSEAEYELLEGLHFERGSRSAVLLSAHLVAESTPVIEQHIVGGAWLSRDLQVDSRTACARIAEWLAGCGVHFFWDTEVLEVEDGIVHTGRGDIAAGLIAVAINYAVDDLYPALPVWSDVNFCAVEVLAIRAPFEYELETPVLTGWSLAHGELFAQRPNGDLLVGERPAVGGTAEPEERLLGTTRELFGTGELIVRERWTGLCARGGDDFFVHAPSDNVIVTSVVAASGMTTAFGFTASVMHEVYGRVRDSSLL